MHACVSADSLRIHKRGLDPLELELQADVSHHACVGGLNWHPASRVRARNSGDISLAPTSESVRTSVPVSKMKNKMEVIKLHILRSY